MKHYVIYLTKLLCDIVECDVIKETDKTIIVKADNFEYRVRKDTTQFGNTYPKLLCLTLKEAQIKQKQLLESKLEAKRERIKGIQEDIKIIEEFLKGEQ